MPSIPGKVPGGRSRCRTTVGWGHRHRAGAPRRSSRALVTAIAWLVLSSGSAWCQAGLGADPLPPALAARTTEASDSLGAARDKLFQILVEGAPVDLDAIERRLEDRFPGIALDLATSAEEMLVRLLSHDWDAFSLDVPILDARESSRNVLGTVVARPDPLARNLLALAKERRHELRAGILAHLSGPAQDRAILILDAVVLEGADLAGLRARRDALHRQGIAIPYVVEAWIGKDLPKSRNAFTLLVGAGGFAGTSPMGSAFASGPVAGLQTGWMRRFFWAEVSAQAAWGDLRRPLEWRGHRWDPSDDIERSAFEIRGAVTPDLLSPRLSLGPILGWGLWELRDSSVAKREGLGKDDRSHMGYSYHFLAGLTLQYRTRSWGPMHGLLRLQGGRRFALDDPANAFSDERWFFEVQAGAALIHLLTSGLHP